MFGIIGWGMYLKEREKRKVCVYAGSGAELAKDVEFALNKLGISYDEVNEDEIKKGKLKSCPVLIIPGGYTKKSVNALSGQGFKMIREFVNNGGSYIGICAGAYLASEIVEVPGKPQGLGIIDIKNIRKSGRGMRKIYLQEHPIAKNLEKELEIYYQNGPEILAEGKVKEVARYENKTLAVVTSFFGKGKVVIFSPHPEGSITQGVKPNPGTLGLLKNSIEFCLKNQN